MLECNGRRPGDAWAITHVEHFRILGQLGPGADQTHFAAENVVELRKLIDLGLAKEPANPSDAIIVRLGEAGTAFSYVGRPHATEVANPEKAPASSHARLEREFCRMIRER